MYEEFRVVKLENIWICILSTFPFNARICNICNLWSFRVYLSLWLILLDLLLKDIHKFSLVLKSEAKKINLFPSPHIVISNDLRRSQFSFVLVQFSCSVVSDSLWPHGLQQARPPCPSPTPGACSNPCPLSWWAIQPPHPLLSPSPPAFNLSQHQGLFKWVSSSHQVAKVLQFQL